MRKLVIIIISGLVLLIVISGCEIFYNLLISKTYLGDVKIAFTVEDLTQELTFNQGPAPTDVEYAWRIFIDTDGNPGTGDVAGFEVQIELEYLSYATNTAYLADIIDYDGADKEISSWNGSAWEVSDNCEVFLDGSTLYFGADSTDSLFANLAPAYRTRFSTEHHTGAATVTDVIDADLTGNNTGTDPLGDSAYPFINIIEVEIEFP
jgi:hypothetical protein